jgi:hypothetical protein
MSIPALRTAAVVRASLDAAMVPRRVERNGSKRETIHHKENVNMSQEY